MYYVHLYIIYTYIYTHTHKHFNPAVPYPFFRLRSGEDPNAEKHRTQTLR